MCSGDQHRDHLHQRSRAGADGVMKVVEPLKVHEDFRTDLIALLRKHAGKLSAMDMLALGAHLVGQLIAMQDQKKVTPEIALDVVMKNIEQGNQETIGNIFANPAGSA